MGSKSYKLPPGEVVILNHDKSFKDLPEVMTLDELSEIVKRHCTKAKELEKLISFAQEHNVHSVLKGKHPSSRTIVYYLVVDAYSQKFMDSLSAFEIEHPKSPEIQVLPLRNYETQGKEIWRKSA